MSADTRPISPGRFAAALKDLSISMLHLKVLEIRNSIAHLQYSNDQLKPFAEGSLAALGEGNSNSDAHEPDQDCIDAIRENEVVIDRMAERIALVRAEVEERGMSWTEFQSKEEAEAAAEQSKTATTAEAHLNGHGEATHSAWTDGTFQTGTIRNGQIHMDGQSVFSTAGGNNSGGRLDDDELRRAMEQRMRDLGTEDNDDDDGGMHL